MPSQITHYLFASEVLRELFDNNYVQSYEKEIALGAQGPDIFFHNRRSKPSCVMWGALVHKKGYGTLSKHMADYAIKNGFSIHTPENAFLLSFATHPILDRKLHPFINYFAGWVGRDDENSNRYKHCHPFLERLLDIGFLRNKRGESPSDLHFFGRVYLGAELPERILDLMAYALCKTYSVIENDDKIVQRIQNAYHDAMGFYKWTNRVDLNFLREMYHREKKMMKRTKGPNPRWIALLHPITSKISFDYMNSGHKRWSNPCDINDSSTFSAYELYDQAKEHAKMALQTLISGVEGKGRSEVIESAIGNSNLADEYSASCKKRFMNPFPLHELMQHILSEIAAGEN